MIYLTIAVDPFIGSYASERTKDMNIFTHLFNCMNFDDNHLHNSNVHESWCLPDAPIPEISPSLSFLTTITNNVNNPSNTNNDSANTTTTTTTTTTASSNNSDYSKQKMMIHSATKTKGRTKSVDSTMTKSSNSSSYTTSDETNDAIDDDNVDDDNNDEYDITITDSELIVNNDWSLSYEPEIDPELEEKNRHEQEDFLIKMRRQHTFYGEDYDDLYSGGRKFY